MIGRKAAAVGAAQKSGEILCVPMRELKPLQFTVWENKIEEVVKNNGKVKAIFLRSRNSVLSKDELEKMLKKKYGEYYDIIKVHRQWEKCL